MLKKAICFLFHSLSVLSFQDVGREHVKEIAFLRLFVSPARRSDCRNKEREAAKVRDRIRHGGHNEGCVCCLSRSSHALPSLSFSFFRVYRQTHVMEKGKIRKKLTLIPFLRSFSFRTSSISEMNRNYRKDMTKEWTR